MLHQFYLQFPLRLPHNKELRGLSIKSRLIELLEETVFNFSTDAVTDNHHL